MKKSFFVITFGGFVCPCEIFFAFAKKTHMGRKKSLVIPCHTDKRSLITICADICYGMEIFMEELLRAELTEKVKKLNTIKTAVVLAISVLGLVLAVVNLLSASFLFAFVYFIAGVLGVIYSAIEINQTFVPRITLTEDMLYLRTWDNGFLPYNIDFKPAFFQDFIPSKSVVYEIPLSEISEIAIGSKGFLIKSVKDIELNNIFSEISKRNPRTDGLMKRIDILCVRLRDGKIYAMNVNKFDLNSIYDAIDYIEHRTSELEFKTNVRVLRRRRDTLSGKKDGNG